MISDNFMIHERMVDYVWKFCGQTQENYKSLTTKNPYNIMKSYFGLVSKILQVFSFYLIHRIFQVFV